MRYPILLLLILVLFSPSCKKTEAPQAPCEGITIDQTILSSLWSKNMYTHCPIAFEDKILVAGEQASSNASNKLNCFDIKTGELLWQKNISASFLDNYTQISGSKLFYLALGSNTFFEFDLNTLEEKAICKLPVEVGLDPLFALGKGYAIVLAHSNPPAIDSVDSYAYLLDLQGDKYREILRRRTKAKPAFIRPFSDPVTEIMPNGDTLFCCMEAAYSPAIGNLEFRLVCHEIKSGLTVTTPASQTRTYYRRAEGNVILKNGRVFFLLEEKVNCLDAKTANVIWSKPCVAATQIILREDRLIAYKGSGFIDALNPLSGEKYWSSSAPTGFLSGLMGSFVRNGRLYFMENFKLTSLDFETGCYLSKQSLPNEEDLEDILRVSSDGKTVFCSDFKNCFAVKLPE
jgi:hypothetical protein